MRGLDSDLVYLASENAREKIKELSLVLKKSSPRLKYTLKLLEREGVLYNPYTVFDYSYFGLMLFRVYFKGGYISENDKVEIIKKLQENNYIVAMYELNGEFDLAIEIESPNPSRFNKELKKVASLIPSLNTFKMVLNVVTHLYPRTYLIKSQIVATSAETEIIVGGDRSIELFSTSEMMVMKALLEHPRLRLTHLAQQAELNVKTASSILLDLRKRKIIKGFKYLLDVNRLNLYKFRVFLTLHNISQEREDEMLAYFMNVREVVQVNKTIGDWNLEVDIESLDKTKIRLLITEMRERFKEIISYFNLIEFYQYYERAFLPKYLFEGYEKVVSTKSVPVVKTEVEGEKAG